MRTTIYDILTEILTIAGFASDKETFITEFERLNILETMTHIYDTLPKENQNQIKANIDNPYLIQQYIPQKAYITELIKVTRSALTALIKDMTPSLTLYQREKINSLVVTL